MAPTNAIRHWREDPIAFVYDVIRKPDGSKVSPDNWQLEVLDQFAKHNRICLLASKGVGKTFILSMCILNFMVTRLMPNVGATSITGPNLFDGIWKEMAYWIQSSPLLGSELEVTGTSIYQKQNKNTWWTRAKPFSKSASPEQQGIALAGLHSDNVLFVLDEVSAIPDTVVKTAEAALSTGSKEGKEAKIIMAGNPTQRSGPLWNATNVEKHLWYVKSINGDPDNPDRSPRVDIEWARDLIRLYGRDNAWVKVNVLGEFPSKGLDSIIDSEDVDAAFIRRLDESSYGHMSIRMGIDVARGGGDRTVIYVRQGKMSWEPVILRERDGRVVANVAMNIAERYNVEMMFVDNTGGYGGSVVDTLTSLGAPVTPINFSSSAADKRYANIRAEMWFRMAEWIKGGGSLINVDGLMEELTQPTSSFDGSDRILMQKKNEIKKLLGFSPDLADALALTFAYPESIKAEVGATTHISRMKDYDPFDF